MADGKGLHLALPASVSFQPARQELLLTRDDLGTAGALLRVLQDAGRRRAGTPDSARRGKIAECGGEPLPLHPERPQVVLGLGLVAGQKEDLPEEAPADGCLEVETELLFVDLDARMRRERLRIPAEQVAPVEPPDVGSDVPGDDEQRGAA